MLYWLDVMHVIQHNNRNLYKQKKNMTIQMMCWHDVQHVCLHTIRDLYRKKTTQHSSVHIIAVIYTCITTMRLGR